MRTNTDIPRNPMKEIKHLKKRQDREWRKLCHMMTHTGGKVDGLLLLLSSSY
jgi:hypothetical protein